MTISKDERHQAILEILQRLGSSSVTELGASLGVAEMTIRRDLETLEGRGVLRRFHGGAKLSAGSSYEPPFGVREHTNVAQKRAIAEAVAGTIEDGETILLDGGSTGIQIAEALADRMVTICPLSLRVAWALNRSTSVTLMLPPGRARPGELSISGPDTTDYLKRHHFDRFLLTASAFSPLEGFTEWNTDDAGVKRAALDSAGEVIACVDSSKFGRVGFVEICGIDVPDLIVVDGGLDETSIEALTASSRRVRLAA
ncbi:DeoR/GlpR family DNA-binding transcription regulator [Subtercola boreus]|uniref:DeoR/GlpR family DNA-binding transcription regulator n=1 Tax=Subtercola boreus TaxID=120213 RepID=UPI001558FD13|nr:DeoR/GlpR family DNA-binding transcription regulator [Subtercola boreus]